MVTQCVGSQWVFVRNDSLILAPLTEAVAATGVQLNETALTLNLGGTEQQTATVTPAEATNKTVTWTTGNPDVATVDQGFVTAKAVGTTTIIISTTDGNFKATCTVTVENTGGTNVWKDLNRVC